MLSEAKHLALEQGFFPVSSVRFFAEFILERSEGLRMTSCICSCQSYTYVKTSQVELLATSGLGHNGQFEACTMSCKHVDCLTAVIEIDATTDDNLNAPASVWEVSTRLHKAHAAHDVPKRH